MPLTSLASTHKGNRMKAIMREQKTSTWTALPAVLAFLMVGTGCGAGSKEQEPESPPPTVAEPAEVQDAAAPVEAKEPAAPAPTEDTYGEHDGKPVKLYTLTNKNGLVLKATNYGAIITELHVPDAKGALGDIVQGFDSLDEYVKSSPYFGATIGRLANRIKNAKFELEGK
jgi:aldose 1-epimerase